MEHDWRCRLELKKNMWVFWICYLKMHLLCKVKYDKDYFWFVWSWKSFKVFSINQSTIRQTMSTVPGNNSPIRWSLFIILTFMCHSSRLHWPCDVHSRTAQKRGEKKIMHTHQWATQCSGKKFSGLMKAELFLEKNLHNYICFLKLKMDLTIILRKQSK